MTDELKAATDRYQRVLAGERVCSVYAGDWRTAWDRFAADKSLLADARVAGHAAADEPAVAIDVPGLGPCIIADIGLRMLTPRELARAQGFPDTYVLTGSNSNQVARIGNSVSPYIANAMVAANYRSRVKARR